MNLLSASETVNVFAVVTVLAYFITVISLVKFLSVLFNNRFSLSHSSNVQWVYDDHDYAGLALMLFLVDIYCFVAGGGFMGVIFIANPDWGKKVVIDGFSATVLISLFVVTALFQGFTVPFPANSKYSYEY